MKKSFSIIETLISVLLLSVAIGALLQTKNNNLYILSSIDQKSDFDGLISIHSISNASNDEKINFKNYVSLSNDDLRRNLKDERIEFKKQLNNKIEIKDDNIDLNFEIYEESYTSDKFGKKSFYRVTLNE